MIDLLKRLRTMAATGWNPIGDEAADTITALRAEVERLKAVENDYDDHEREMIDLEEDNTRLVAENKRLRKALRGMVDNACAACDEDYVIRATKVEWDAHVKATAQARSALEEKQ